MPIWNYGRRKEVTKLIKSTEEVVLRKNGMARLCNFGLSG